MTAVQRRRSGQVKPAFDPDVRLLNRMRAGNPERQAQTLRAALRPVDHESFAFYGATSAERVAFVKRTYPQLVQVFGENVIRAAAFERVGGCRWCLASALSAVYGPSRRGPDAATRHLLGEPCARHTQQTTPSGVTASAAASPTGATVDAAGPVGTRVVQGGRSVVVRVGDPKTQQPTLTARVPMKMLSFFTVRHGSEDCNPWTGCVCQLAKDPR